MFYNKNNEEKIVELLENGVEFKRNGKYLKSLKCYKKALSIADENKNQESIGALYYSLGKLYYIMGEYDKSVEAYCNCNPKLRPMVYNGYLEMHLGHALLDSKLVGDDIYYREAYRCSIDPYYAKNHNSNFLKNQDSDYLHDYSDKCAYFVIDNYVELKLFEKFM